MKTKLFTTLTLLIVMTIQSQNLEVEEEVNFEIKHKREDTEIISKRNKESEATKIDNVEQSEAKYTFFNGLNFDFTDSDKTKYVGHFNIYVPANDNNNWGINTGVLKISYKPNDSLVNNQIDLVQINPLDVIDGAGDKFNKQFNQYSTQTKVTSYSLYAQPMYRFIKNLGKAQIYLHGHIELLMLKYETTTNIKNIQTEEITISDGDPIPLQTELKPLLSKATNKKTNLNTGNFGAGITVDFNFTDNCVLFIQPTIGLSLNNANNFPTIDAEGDYSIATSSKSQGFYLVRTNFQYFISKASQINLGTDIRGYFPKQTPYTSIYVGLNLGLDKIFNFDK